MRASQANSPCGSGGTETGWVHRNDVTQNNKKKGKQVGEVEDS